MMKKKKLIISLLLFVCASILVLNSINPNSIDPPGALRIPVHASINV